MNQKGFGLTELLLFIVGSLVILGICVISYDQKFGGVEEPDYNSMIKQAQMVEDKKETNIKPKEEVEKKDNVDKKYKEIMDKMISTSKIYITDNYTGKTDQMIIKVSELIEKEYMEELVNPNNKDEECSGYIIYDGDSNYDAYLKCGEDYQSDNYNPEFE